MAAIDFPNSPSVGTIHTVDNKRWEYDAEKWILLVDYITPNVSGTVYNATIGDGTNTSYVVSHNFNSRDVSVTVRQAASPYGLISASWEATTTNAITLSFNSAPSASSVRVSVYIAVAGLEVGATGATGATGPAGMVIQGTAPIDTTVIWADTSTAGVAVVPTGGATGQTLIKASSTSYDTAWATPVTSGDMALKADLASPALTGTPTAPTATAATNTTQIATTAFVRTEVANLVASAPAALDTLDELALALGDDANFATTTATAIGLKAPIASPTFTGTVTIPSGASISGFAPLASPTFTGTVSGITATMVGLGSVNNTADTAKPVSTAQQTALNLKADLASPTFTGTLNAGIISTTDTIASAGRGEFTTVTAAGRGVGIKAPPGDASAGILQFTNNAMSAQWATITATSNNLNLNAIVSKASQPSFLIYTGGYNHASNWQDISLLGGTAIVSHNNGSHWNSSTGLFTAPATGYYLFYAGGWGNYNGAGNRYGISFSINQAVGGDWLFISGANTSLVDSPLAMSPVVRYMASGDYMRTTMFSSVGMQLGTSSHKFYYGGYFLG